MGVGGKASESGGMISDRVEGDTDIAVLPG